MATGGGPSDHVRDEAERLIAAAISAVSMAAQGLGGVGRDFATGSPECCLCPVCRVIAAMRDPRADVAERLAAGAGDLASGVASILRAFAPAGVDPESTREGDEFWESLRQRARSARPRGSDDPWRNATHDESAPHDGTDGDDETDAGSPRSSGRSASAAPMAKKAVKKAAAKPGTDAPKAGQTAATSQTATSQTVTEPAPADADSGTRADAATGRKPDVATGRKPAKKAVRKAAPPSAGGDDA